MHAALQRAGVPPSLPMARWLAVEWINVLRWPSLLAALVLPLLLGAEWRVYLCVAAMRSLTAAARHVGHPAELLVLTLQPLEYFDVLAAMPFMLELRHRHAAVVGRLLRESLTASSRAVES